MILIESTREEYVTAQLAKFFAKRHVAGPPLNTLVIVADAITARCDDVKQGICHGVRTGDECRSLTTVLKVPVYGTDIGPISGEFMFGNFDFHEQKKEWVGSFDFVYSNALDHSFNPGLALRVWREQLRDGGVLCLHYTFPHRTPEPDRADCFYGSLQEYIDLLATVTQGVDVIRISRRQRLLVGRT